MCKICLTHLRSTFYHLEIGQLIFYENHLTAFCKSETSVLIGSYIAITPQQQYHKFCPEVNVDYGFTLAEYLFTEKINHQKYYKKTLSPMTSCLQLLILY